MDGMGWVALKKNRLDVGSWLHPQSFFSEKFGLSPFNAPMLEAGWPFSTSIFQGRVANWLVVFSHPSENYRVKLENLPQFSGWKKTYLKCHRLGENFGDVNSSIIWGTPRRRQDNHDWHTEFHASNHEASRMGVKHPLRPWRKQWCV